MASILERMQAKFNELKELEIDLGPVSTNVVVKAHDVTTFPSQWDGEACTGAIQTGDIVLTEVTLGKQEKGQQGAKTGEWLIVLETAFALPEARLGIYVDGEFHAIPIYEEEYYAPLIVQTPLVFGQLLKADFVKVDGAATAKESIEPGEQLQAFLALAKESGYIARKVDPNSTFVSQRDRILSWEAPNRQTGSYGNDLEERIRNGLQVSSFTVVPPTDERPNQFTDLLTAYMDNVDRVLNGLQDDDVQTRRNARKLMSSLTGVNDEDGIYANRATIPQLTISSGHYEGQGRTLHWVEEPDQAFSFWAPRTANTADNNPAA